MSNSNVLTEGVVRSRDACSRVAAVITFPTARNDRPGISRPILLAPAARTVSQELEHWFRLSITIALSLELSLLTAVHGMVVSFCQV